MSIPGPDLTHGLVRHLAEESVATELFWETVKPQLDPEAAPVASAPSMRALLAYARRSGGAPANLTIERAIRNNPAVALRYRNLLKGLARAASPVALAAAAGGVTMRNLGAWRLGIVEQDGESPVLMIEVGSAAAPTSIEAVGSEGAVRLPLPEPINDTIQLLLDEEIAELATFRRLIADPATAVYLF
jgi:hypothetical protein